MSVTAPPSAQEDPQMRSHSTAQPVGSADTTGSQSMEGSSGSKQGPTVLATMLPPARTWPCPGRSRGLDLQVGAGAGPQTPGGLERAGQLQGVCALGYGPLQSPARVPGPLSRGCGPAGLPRGGEERRWTESNRQARSCGGAQEHWRVPAWPAHSTSRRQPSSTNCAGDRESWAGSNVQGLPPALSPCCRGHL